MKKILVLYRELAGYFVACLNHLCDEYDVEATLVAYPIHKDAPFQFQLSSRITHVQRNTLNQEDLMRLCTDSSYDLIFAGGWADKEYLKGIAASKTTSLLGFDNQWNGSVKHLLSAMYGRIKIKPLFDYAFVPGSKQFRFAQKLGFSSENIITGAYSCDHQRFASIAEHRFSQQQNAVPKRLIYTGRYAPEKFIQELLMSFEELCGEGIGNWELHCAGTGPLFNHRLQTPHIIHHGFMQPDQLVNLMKTGDAFVLPSTFEPWGVVVHEFAAAGYPMVLSTRVGAGEAFLNDGENGYLFLSGDQEDLKRKLKKLLTLSDDQLLRMGHISASMSKSITPDTWSRSLFKLM